MRFRLKITCICLLICQCLVSQAYVLLDSAAYKACPDVCRLSPNRGKSVAVFGGSFSMIEQSEVAKNMWREYLDMSVTTYGRSGAGFCVPNNTFKAQVQRAGVHDIYVFWCSTNDCSMKTPVEEQNEKMLECFDLVRQKNPQAVIYVLTTMKAFSKAEWVQTAEYYKQEQAKTASGAGVLYLDLYDLPFATSQNVGVLCQSDMVHPSADGYYNYGWNILYFLATEFNFDYDAPNAYHDGINVLGDKVTSKTFVSYPARFLDVKEIAEYQKKYGAREVVNLTYATLRSVNGTELGNVLKKWIKIDKECQDIISTY